MSLQQGEPFAVQPSLTQLPRSQDYAAPLREFAKSRSTAIVPLFEANHLFVNIDELVPLAASFEADLRDVVGRSQRDKASLPTGFGEVILHHVRLPLAESPFLHDRVLT